MEGADRAMTPFGAFLRSVGNELAGNTANSDAPTQILDRSQWRRLFEPVTPIIGESLRGLVARSCRANHLPNSFGLLQHLGLVHRNRVIVSESPDIEALRTADRSAIFRTIVQLANGIGPSEGQATFEEPEIRLGALHAACVAVQAWPNGLEEVRLRNDAAPSARETIKKAWNRLAARNPVTSITRARRQPGEPKRKPGPKTDQGPVGIRQATEIARLSPDVLTSIWNHRLVTQHQRNHGERVLPAFDPQELAIIGPAWRARREPDSVAADFGIPRYGIEQLAELGCLVPDAVAIPGTGPHFTPERIASFVKTMEGSRTDIEDPIALAQAMRLAGGRLKPWGPTFALMLDGTIPFDVRDGKSLVERLVVSRRRVPLIADLHFEMPVLPRFGFAALMPQNDALEVLNATYDLIHILDDLPSKGRNPKLYRVADIERRASEIVTINELAARRGVDPSSAWQELRRRNLLHTADAQGAWPRTILARMA